MECLHISAPLYARVSCLQKCSDDIQNSSIVPSRQITIQCSVLSPLVNRTVMRQINYRGHQAIIPWSLICPCGDYGRSLHRCSNSREKETHKKPLIYFSINKLKFCRKNVFYTLHSEDVTLWYYRWLSFPSFGCRIWPKVLISGIGDDCTFLLSVGEFDKIVFSYIMTYLSEIITWQKGPLKPSGFRYFELLN